MNQAYKAIYYFILTKKARALFVGGVVCLTYYCGKSGLNWLSDIWIEAFNLKGKNDIANNWTNV